MFQTLDIDKCREIVHEWEQRTGMNMEEDTIQEVYQKDVNNYFLLMNSGEIKSKGGYVKNYSVKFKNGELKEIGGDFTSNSMTIVDKAIVKNMLYGIPVEQTIYECDEPIKFQITTKKGPTYKRVEYEVNGEFLETNNVNRVFATKETKYGKLFKVKQNGRKDTIASLPEHCMIFNKDIKDMDISLIDKDWYIGVAKERIADFKGE